MKGVIGRRATWTAAAIGALLPSVAAAQIAPGCYDVAVGPWSPVGPEGVPAAGASPSAGEPDSLYHAVPPRLRLEDEPGGWGSEGRRVSVPEGALDVPHRFRTWWQAGDTLRVTFSTGFSGTTLLLLRGAGGWVGHGTTFTDAGGAPRHRRPVRLTAVACGTPPPVPASRDDPVPRSVPLADGGALELARPVPDGVRLEPRPSGAWTALVRAGGLWAGHDTVVVRLDREGAIHHLELRYPPGHDVAPLLDSLAAAHPPDDVTDGRPRWANRTTRVLFFDDPRPRFILIDPRRL